MFHSDPGPPEIIKLITHIREHEYDLEKSEGTSAYSRADPTAHEKRGIREIS